MRHLNGHYDFQGDRAKHARLQVVDDDLQAKIWIDRFSAAGKSMRLQQVEYRPTAGPNSNTVAKHLLMKVGINPPTKHPRRVWGWGDDWPEIWSLLVQQIAD